MYAMHLETALLLKQAPPNYFGVSRQIFVPLSTSSKPWLRKIIDPKIQNGAREPRQSTDPRRSKSQFLPLKQ